LKRRQSLLLTGGVLLAALAILAFFLYRERVRRHRVFRPAAGEVKPEPPQGVPPAGQWTVAFQQLDGEDLDDLLDQIETKHADLYARWSLGYLHARVLIEENEKTEALRRLTPFLEKGNPFRELALYHRASLADGEEASRFRMQLMEEHPQSIYRDEAIDEELDHREAAGDPQALLDFAAKVSPSASTERRREIGARIVETLVRRGDIAGAMTRGLAILNGGTGDDASDRVVRALDRPDVLAKLSAAQLALFGETFQKHRHYDRAIAVLQLALRAGYTDDLQFAHGRCYFGAERYAEAQAAYLRGAKATKNPQMQCMFLWHAARAAQLRGDDVTAERLMTEAIAVKGTFPSTTPALTQRLRTRLKRNQVGAAAADLALLRKMAGNERAIVEGSLAYAVGMLALGNAPAALSTLNSIPPKLVDPYDRAEMDYWRARALEDRDAPGSFRAYLDVLRADVPTHFAYFARNRLDSPAMAAKLDRELKVREAQVANLVAARKLELAKSLQTDRILLSSRDAKAQLEKLAAIYRELPPYRAVLELEPDALPRFPVQDTGRDTLLMAMALYDEAAPAVQKRWPLRPARSALTRSLALNLGGASRESIYAIEVMMKAVPRDYHPDLLPEVVRRLLYPRYFYSSIVADAEKYEADPNLVLAIMREESRFDPRAKSQAAARGLLQFIITTARDIGRDVGLVDVSPEDLYDPRVIIQLGAKYISELSGQFAGDRYRTTAAYNAGPKQVALWTRIQPAPGDDYFLTAVNFDETKHYVRKVMNSYERYVEIYGKTGPRGGLRAEP
jgi:soluble lytic murein transglycosylase-like protein